MKTRLPINGPTPECRNFNSGAALAVVLPLLVLMTVAVVAFFVLATSHRTETNARAKRTAASQIATSGATAAADLLRSEMVTESDEVGATGDLRPVLSPQTAADAVVSRRLATGIPVNDADFSSLVRQSVPGGSPPAEPAASTHSTEAPALGGRRVPPERWNLPRLLRGAASFTDGANRVPHWVYIGPDGPEATPPADAIGRFAYNVYETGGLLDASVAGFPTGVDDATLRFSAAGADLNTLPGVAAGAVNSLVAFRNPGVAAGDYPQRVRDLARDGFRLSTSGNSTNKFFFSRQDLLRYAREQNPGIEPALPFLSHRTLQANAPAWGPLYNASDFGGNATFAYEDNRNQPTAINRFLPGLRIPEGGSLVERIDGTIGQPGDPVLDRRFPLEWLAWLADARPETRAFDAGSELLAALDRINRQRAANGAAALTQDGLIRRAFGLEWDSSDATWIYVGADGADTGGIQTDWMAMQPLPSGRLPGPDFFQILRAVILDGSLGLASEDKDDVFQAPLAGRDMVEIEGNKDYHVIQIGANIIDNADRDNFPTTIALGSVSPRLTAHGVEDVPYLASVAVGAISDQARNRPSTPISPPETPAPNMVSNYLIAMVPRFFNPHAPSAPSDTPDGFRCIITGGTISRIEVQRDGYHLGTRGDPSALGQIAPPNTFLNQSVSLPSSAPEDFRSDVLVTASDVSSRLSNRASWTTEEMCGFVLYERSDVEITATSHRAYLYLDNFTVEMQYEHPSGGWRTYDTLAGHENFPQVTGIDGTRLSTQSGHNEQRFFLGTTTRRRTDMETLNYEMTKWDPRTRRWSAAWTGARVTSPANPNGYSASWPVQPPGINSQEVVRAYPFPSLPGLTSSGSNSGEETYPALLPEASAVEEMRNVGGENGFVNKSDEDGVLRAADAWRDGANANLFRDLNDMSRRPVILQRPYRSVGELGHVFRDIPWKSLDFSSDRSADAGLLDVFCIVEEPPISAGRVAANTAPEEIIEALARGEVASPEVMAAGFASAVTPPGGAPLLALSGLSDFADTGGTGDIKAEREAPVRAVGTASQTRTWNLLVDVIAQAGRFPPGGGTDAGDFIVEGEKRIWYHIALDRFTGEILNEQWEEVLE